MDDHDDITPEELAAVDAMRPRTRGDCVDGCRPCPWYGCRYHLGTEVMRGGRLLLAPIEDLEAMSETCALDVADRGARTLEQVSELMIASAGGQHTRFDGVGVTRARVRQIEQQGIHKARRALARMGVAAVDLLDDVTGDGDAMSAGAIDSPATNDDLVELLERTREWLAPAAIAKRLVTTSGKLGLMLRAALSAELIQVCHRGWKVRYAAPGLEVERGWHPGQRRPLRVQLLDALEGSGWLSRDTISARSGLSRGQSMRREIAALIEEGVLIEREVLTGVSTNNTRTEYCIAGAVPPDEQEPTTMGRKDDVLVALRERADWMETDEVASAASINSNSYAGRFLRALEGEGLVERDIDPDDWTPGTPVRWRAVTAPTDIEVPVVERRAVINVLEQLDKGEWLGARAITGALGLPVDDAHIAAVRRVLADATLGGQVERQSLKSAGDVWRIWPEPDEQAEPEDDGEQPDDERVLSPLEQVVRQRDQLAAQVEALLDERDELYDVERQLKVDVEDAKRELEKQRGAIERLQASKTDLHRQGCAIRDERDDLARVRDAASDPAEKPTPLRTVPTTPAGNLEVVRREVVVRSTLTIEADEVTAERAVRVLEAMLDGRHADAVALLRAAHKQERAA